MTLGPIFLHNWCDITMTKMTMLKLLDLTVYGHKEIVFQMNI